MVECEVTDKQGEKLEHQCGNELQLETSIQVHV